MTHRLPPLNALRAFEAAGRHLSFKTAAEELGVTPSAVSHRIQTLEEWLGVALFARGNRSLDLTEAGRAYLPYVRDAFVLLARGTERLPGRAARRTIAISATPTFLSRWLIPRLPRFNGRHPDVVVRLDTDKRHVNLFAGGVDLAIRMGQGSWPGLSAIHLAPVELMPVCAPALAEGPGALRRPEDLIRATLLHVTSVSEDWGAWLEAVGVDGIDLSAGLRFDTAQLATDAAVQGLGVAMGRGVLVADDLAAGRLVQPFGPVVCGSTSFWLVGTGEAMARAEVGAFRDWILEELAAVG